MKKLLSLMFVLFLLVGCGGSDSSETMVCKGTTSGVIEVTNTVEYNGDKVLKQEIKNEVTLEKLGLNKESLEALVSQYSSAYDIEGVTYEYSISEEGLFTETIGIDFEKADFAKLQSAGLIESEDGEEISFVSFSATKEALETFGLKCE